jgi:hypothetical protein
MFRMLKFSNISLSFCIISECFHLAGVRKPIKASTSAVSDNTIIINQITEVADLLLGRGETNIYETTKEGIILSDVSAVTVCVEILKTI